jgi:hypothetical protein
VDLRRALTIAAALAPFATSTAARGQDPVAERLTLLTAPCVSQLVDASLLVEALRVELRARGVVEVALAADDPGAPPPAGRSLRLGCRGSELLVGDGAPVGLPLVDVGVESRPRFVALALAEQLATPPAAATPPPEAAPEAAATSPPAAPRRSSARAGTRLRQLARVTPSALRGWGLAAKLEGLTVPPWVASVLAGGAQVDASYWSETFGVRAGTGLWAGEAAGEAFRISQASVGLGVAGPRLGPTRLDLEVALLGGLAWFRNPDLGSMEMKAFWGFGADLVLRLPLSARWALACNLGYRRLAGGDATDLAALGVSFGTVL